MNNHHGVNLHEQCRFLSLIEALDQSNATEYLRQLTDLNRVHLFDVVMQYRALFSTGSVKDEGNSAVSTGSVRLGGADAVEGFGEIFGWVHHRVQFYVEQMEELLPLCALLSCSVCAPSCPCSKDCLFQTELG